MDLMKSIISSWYLILSSLNSSSIVELLTYAERARVGLVQVGLSPKKELVTHSETMAARREAELQLFYHRIHQYKPTTTAIL